MVFLANPELLKIWFSDMIIIGQQMIYEETSNLIELTFCCTFADLLRMNLMEVLSMSSEVYHVPEEGPGVCFVEIIVESFSLVLDDSIKNS